MVETVKAGTEKLSADVAIAIKDNEKAKADMSELAAQARELGGELEEMEWRKDGELLMRSDGKGGEVPMTTVDRVNIYNDTIRREEEFIKMLQKRIEMRQFTFETKEEMEAKIVFHKQAVAQTQMEREVMIQTGNLFRASQLEQIKREYTAKTNKALEEAKKIDPLVIDKALKSPEVDAVDKRKVEDAIKELTEATKAVQGLKDKKDVPFSESLKKETAWLRARRKLMETAKELAPKTRSITLPAENKVGSINVIKDIAVASLNADNSAPNPVSALVAMAEGDINRTGGEGILGEMSRPVLPTGAGRPVDKGRMT